MWAVMEILHENMVVDGTWRDSLYWMDGRKEQVCDLGVYLELLHKS